MMSPGFPLFGSSPKPNPAPDEDNPTIGDLDDASIVMGDKVLLHRFERFVALGFTIPQARCMALDRGIDTYQAKSLLASGCDPLLALDILS